MKRKQPDLPPVAQEPEKASLAMRIAKGMLTNLLDATPFTNEGLARGMATMAAEARGGLLDLQRAVTMPFPDSQQQEAVLGMIGHPTPGMVDKEQDQGREM